MARHPGRVGPLVDGRADLHPLGQARGLGALLRGREDGWLPRAGHGLHGQHHHPGAPKGGRSRKKGNAAKPSRANNEALGRSQGGFGTKAHALADARGRALGFALTPGQAGEAPQSLDLLAFLPAVPGWVVADRGYSSHAVRTAVWELGSRPAIPTRRNEGPVHCPDWIYVNREQVERMWNRLKEWRAIATRYEKTARSFLSALHLAAAYDWLKP
jgi:transposase